jgi:hypothetical protein
VIQPCFPCQVRGGVIPLIAQRPQPYPSPVVRRALSGHIQVRSE